MLPYFIPPRAHRPDVNGLARAGGQRGARARAGLMAALLLLCAAVLFAGCGSKAERSEGKADSGGKAKQKTGPGTPFRGEAFEASGVVFVPGTNGVLFIDDNKEDKIFWMQVDESGQQVGEVKPIPLGVRVQDPEGITFDGSYYYIIGSQSVDKRGDENALVRFAFDPNTLSVSKAEAVPNFRAFLFDKVPELKGEGEKKAKDGGLNVEAIAADPVNMRLLVGLRSPVVNQQALIIAFRLPAAGAPLSASGLQLAEPHAIHLPLGDLGIRDIQYDGKLKSFFIISGAPEHHESPDFELWQWDGAGDQPASGPGLRKMSIKLNQKMKPEGVTRVEMNGRDYIFIVGDGGSYLKLDYADLQ
ncbi:MAG: DUF3616 domain-containing protein [Blastocatellia bacterium]